MIPFSEKPNFKVLRETSESLFEFERKELHLGGVEDNLLVFFVEALGEDGLALGWV